MWFVVWALPNQKFWLRLWEKLFWRPFFLRTFAAVSLVLGLGLEHSCPWPREGLSSERLSLTLTSDFFVSSALASSIVFSTPPLPNNIGAVKWHLWRVLRVKQSIALQISERELIKCSSTEINLCSPINFKREIFAEKLALLICDLQLCFALSRRPPYGDNLIVLPTRRAKNEMEWMLYKN